MGLRLNWLVSQVTPAVGPYIISVTKLISLKATTFLDSKASVASQFLSAAKTIASILGASSREVIPSIAPRAAELSIRSKMRLAMSKLEIVRLNFLSATPEAIRDDSATARFARTLRKRFAMPGWRMASAAMSKKRIAASWSEHPLQ